MTDFQANRTSLWLSRRLWRGVLVVTGVAILIWSGYEDIDASGAALLGLTAAIGLTMSLMRSRLANDHSQIVISALTGALIGAATSVATAALMLFKDLRHAHPFPDFPPSIILGILERLPPWTLAGALAGIGIGLLLKLYLQAAARNTRG